MGQDSVTIWFQDELVNVASVDCHSDPRICTMIRLDYGTAYFQAGELGKGQGEVRCFRLTYMYLVHAVQNQFFLPFQFGVTIYAFVKNIVIK